MECIDALKNQTARMKTEQQQKDKLLDRVRRLYAMANDSSSPHEAAIALRRVRSLMDTHQLTEADLSQSEFDKNNGEMMSRMPRWYNVLSIGVAAFNDCVAGLEYAGKDKCVQFKGFKNDTISAHLMMGYLTECMQRGWVEFDRTRDRSANTAAAKNSFNNGFASIMQATLKELAAERKKTYTSDTGTALVVVKMRMVSSKFGLQQVSQRRVGISDEAGYGAGQATARKTAISRHVGGSTQRQLS